MSASPHDSLPGDCLFWILEFLSAMSEEQHEAEEEHESDEEHGAEEKHEAEDASPDPKISGDFGAFLELLKTDDMDGIAERDDFQPRMEVEPVEGTDDGETRVTWMSGCGDEYNFRQTFTTEAWEDWCLRARIEAQFTFS